ncbi:sugar phosphate isomerase/epimerase [Robiginitalea sp. SC105]|uniref:sugar phosphate isomerase/epimerase family protein n=1 Tax=Robiginitalea sp. SC105 TaxID=2762332 RepID=UPI00163A87E0|nr:sugar phosphate isomerase/epimerase [Robiginitalea sp. SC105]MBC2839405.1 TIM barrel protein [Robiginitalea sp. SC105]
MMNRNQFLKTTALTAAGSFLLPSRLLGQLPETGLSGKIQRIGVQLFSIPKMLDDRPEAALKMLADMGYEELELYGPYPFSDRRNKERWASLEPMLGFTASGFFGYELAAFKSLLNSFGFRVPSMHTDLDTLENNLPALAAAARDLGATYVTLPSIPEDRRQTLDDYKRMADGFNVIGKAAREEGIRFAYHNHGYGLQESDGQVPFEVLMDATDPEGVFLEMDLFWTVSGRANPSEYLRRYQGRYKMMHIKDMKELKYFAGDGGDPSQWVGLFPNMTTLGDGALDLKPILDTALETGVEHFFVEQDMVADPQSALSASYAYLRSLE